MTLRSCMEYDSDDIDEGYDHDHDQPQLSRLSMCSSNLIDQMSDDHEGNSIYYLKGHEENDMSMSMYMSLLSMDSFDGDVDEEEHEESSNKKRVDSQVSLADEMSTEDDSDKELLGCYSLPATPPRPRRALSNVYGSENEAEKATSDDYRRMMMKNRSSWLEGSLFCNEAKTEMDNDYGEDHDRDENKSMNMCCDHCHSFSGESEGTGMVMIARPKGGKRSLCMDMEEVKACRDLGFELEHDCTLQQQEMAPSRISISASSLDTNYITSSGSNSPITNWRISSPGDHPQDIKARLKVWAQAVALASASPTRHSS